MNEIKQHFYNSLQEFLLKKIFRLFSRVVGITTTKKRVLGITFVLIEATRNLSMLPVYSDLT